MFKENTRAEAFAKVMRCLCSFFSPSVVFYFFAFLKGSTETESWRREEAKNLGRNCGKRTKCGVQVLRKDFKATVGQNLDFKHV